MKAAVTTATGGFELATLPDAVPDVGDLIIRVTACNVCGSDLKAHKHMPAGTIMGHEFCGEVMEKGRDAGDWRIGTNVAVLPFISCGQCAPCQSGDVFHCALLQCIGMGAPSGGFAEFAAVPAHHAFILPEGAPDGIGAFVEPLAVALRASKVGDLKLGEHVLIVGAGGVGLTMLLWAKALGAGRITVAEPHAERRQVAALLGATDILASSAEAGQNSYDVLVDCVGATAIIEHLVAAARPHARIVMAGTIETPVAIPPVVPMLKALSIRYSVASRPEDFRQVIAAIDDGLIDPAPLIGESFGLERMADAFTHASNPSIKGRTMIRPWR